MSYQCTACRPALGKGRGSLQAVSPPALSDLQDLAMPVSLPMRKGHGPRLARCPTLAPMQDFLARALPLLPQDSPIPVREVCERETAYLAVLGRASHSLPSSRMHPRSSRCGT